MGPLPLIARVIVILLCSLITFSATAQSVCTCDAFHAANVANGGPCACWTVQNAAWVQFNDPIVGEDSSCGTECSAHECHYDWALTFTIVVAAGCAAPSLSGCFIVSGMPAPLCVGVAYASGVPINITIHNGLACNQDMVSWIEIVGGGCDQTNISVSEKCCACRGQGGC